MEKRELDNLLKEGTPGKDFEFTTPPPEQLQQAATSAKSEKEENVDLIHALRKKKRPVSAVPTYVPRNLIEQFVLYENGATRRLYVWVEGTWRYAALT